MMCLKHANYSEILDIPEVCLVKCLDGNNIVIEIVITL